MGVEGSPCRCKSARGPASNARTRDRADESPAEPDSSQLLRHDSVLSLAVGTKLGVVSLSNGRDKRVCVRFKFGTSHAAKRHVQGTNRPTSLPADDSRASEGDRFNHDSSSLREHTSGVVLFFLRPTYVLHRP
jgi:hypothetical protein